jgi:hypothetical protein
MITTDNETTTGTATVSITYGQLASIASMAIFTAKDAYPMVIGGVRVAVDQGVNGGYVIAQATDRYRLGEISFQTDYTGTEPIGATIPAKVLTDFTKTHKPARTDDASLPVVELTISETSYTLKHLISGASTSGATISGTYPPLGKLWPVEASAIPSFSINPSFFADLAKVVNPRGEQLKDFWELSFSGTAEKPGPVTAAHYGSDGGTLVRVLMQPKLTRR